MEEFENRWDLIKNLWTGKNLLD